MLLFAAVGLGERTATAANVGAQGSQLNLSESSAAVLSVQHPCGH